MSRGQYQSDNPYESSHSDSVAANPYASFGGSIADAPAETRADFIRKTYTHLMMAIFAFAALEWAYFQALPLDDWMPALMGNRMLMLAFFGAFILVSHLADSWARSSVSIERQYMGLVGYVLAESIFFVPMLWAANFFALDIGGGQAVGVLPVAAVITLIMFSGLTAIAWFSGADFSFMRAGLAITGIAAFGLILVSMIFGMELGVWFSAAMIIFACCYILYDTSNILHHYRQGQHVAASLALFASVALLFWYVLRILIQLSSRR